MLKERQRINNKEDVILSISAFIQIVLLTLQVILNGLNIFSYEQTKQINIAVSAIFMFFAFIIIFKHNLKLVFTSYIIIGFLLLISIALNPENINNIQSNLFNLLAVNIPVFLCIVSIKNIEVLKKVILKISYLIFALGLLFFILFSFGRISFITYNMSFSYYLLLPTLIFAYKRNFFHNILMIMTFLLMILFGARGPIFISLIFFIIINIFYFKKRNLWSIIPFILLILFILLTYNINYLSLFIENKIGFNPRTIRLIETGFFDDSGRGGFIRPVWEQIVNYPFKFNGLFSDRIILPDNAYTHNFFIEFLHNFGLLIGGFLIIILLISIIKTYIKINQQDKMFFLFFIFYGFLPLMISSSYLVDSKFWIFLGSMFLLKNNINQKVFV